VLSTVIKIHSNHGNIRHIGTSESRLLLLPITNFNIGILINSIKHYKYKNTIRVKHPVAMTIQTGNEIIEYNVNVIMSD